MSLILGVIYETKDSSGFPKGTRMEFIGGAEDDVFTDGLSIEFYDQSEVLRSPDQSPIECSEVIQVAKSKAMSGYDPD